MTKRGLMVYVFLGLAAFGLVHQKLMTGCWFTWEQFWHHEPLIAICLVVGMWELIRSRLWRNLRRER